jgi:hypothetical protein
MQNKRALERRNLLYYLQVVNQSTGDPIGRLVDITREGMMLVSEQALPIETIFQLRMLLPAGTLEKTHLDFEAKSLWCQQDVNPRFFDTGFQLLNVDLKDITTIEALITDYGFPAQ